MTTRLIAYVTALLLFLGASTPLYAWNELGHMAVAFAAYQQLTPATRARVKVLLKLNPYAKDKTKWPAKLQGVSAKNKDAMTFMLAATWPDAIKQDKKYHDDGAIMSNGKINGDRPPTDGTADRNDGYVDKARHKYWHFIDTPFVQDSTTPPPIPTPNVEMRIDTFRAVLSSSEPDPLKSYDLTWLLHLVGDIHQPLHCATRVSATDKNGDNGGNSVKLTTCSTCELHAFWDGILGTGKSLQSAVNAAQALPSPDPAAAATNQATKWAAESFQVAQTAVYIPPIGSGNGPFTPTAAYRNAAKALARQRVALAAARLANLLNNELK